jgi:pyruvate/2-oxoglutarate dehydrogenase complex dihydrolipoamide dehydrogenase (E3) component
MSLTYGFDLVCIGSGPAGQRAAIQAAKLGQWAAVAEKRHGIGAVCIETGTIPFFRMLFHREDRRLLGVHCMGTGAAELVHVGQAVLGLGGGLDCFMEIVFNYPTLAERYKVAALDASKVRA